MFLILRVRILTTLVLFGLIAAASLSVPQAIFAAQTTIRATVPLSVDCSHVPDTAEAHSFLAQHTLCGYGLSRSVSPNTIAYGNCGSLSLSTFNNGGGVMLWKAEPNSSLGPFAGASYNGSWSNNTNGRYGSVARGTGLTFTTNWVDTTPISTGAGTVFSDISSANFALVYGLTCTNNFSVVDVQVIR